MSDNAKLFGLGAIAALVLIAFFSDWVGDYREGFDDVSRSSLQPGQASPPVAQEFEPSPRPIDNRMTVADLPSNKVAPDPEIFRGRPDLQEAFNDNARLGEFVSPPSAGVEQE
ncbi:hypothetical protein OIK40_05935 [Erythrobacter sp. sf7]|uniref:Uncharacterized protein n=1 Tax=Erythrobacter fulvus TaxID=2987523 RepID=A0ABT5JPY7_9SPHN|nr:hypothetical protein [Erythrobacter fulvus]MDC8754183.1 hypothetical protein [Erythrobacter fulvus]